MFIVAFCDAEQVSGEKKKRFLRRGLEIIFFNIYPHSLKHEMFTKREGFPCHMKDCFLKKIINNSFDSP